MAKKQSFADKASKKKGEANVAVKVVKAVKTDRGSYKFNERFVMLDDVAKVTEIK